MRKKGEKKRKNITFLNSDILSAVPPPPPPPPLPKERVEGKVKEEKDFSDISEEKEEKEEKEEVDWERGELFVLFFVLLFGYYYYYYLSRFFFFGSVTRIPYLFKIHIKILRGKEKRERKERIHKTKKIEIWKRKGEGRKGKET